MKQQKHVWLAIGRRSSDSGLELCVRKSALAATKEGRDRTANGSWLTFRVARETANYSRGAVRL